MQITDILLQPIHKAKSLYNSYIAQQQNVVQIKEGATDVPEDTSKRNVIIGIVFTTLLILFATIVASIVTNHMIMYPIGMRALMFPLTLTACIFNPLIMFGLIAYYFILILTRFYFNIGKEASEKTPLMPYIYTLWPLSTHKYQSTLMYLLTSPFVYYPEQETVNLTASFVDTLHSIQSSFHNFEETTKIGKFKELYNKFKVKLNKQHEYTRVDERGNPETHLAIPQEIVDRA
jgi:hypothetical protein